MHIDSHTDHLDVTLILSTKKLDLDKRRAIGTEIALCASKTWNVFSFHVPMS